MSPRTIARRVRLALFCPITSHAEGYPFEMVLPGGLGVHGALSAARGPPQSDLGFDSEPDLDQTPAFDTTDPERIPDFDGADPERGA